MDLTSILVKTILFTFLPILNTVSFLLLLTFSHFAGYHNDIKVACWGHSFYLYRYHLVHQSNNNYLPNAFYNHEENATAVLSFLQPHTDLLSSFSIPLNIFTSINYNTSEL